MPRQLHLDFYRPYGKLAEEILAELRGILEDHDKISTDEAHENRDDLVDDLINNPECYLSVQLLDKVQLYKKNNRQ